MVTQNRDHKKCADGMTLSWQSEKLARTWCHCDGDFCTWKQSMAALRRAGETAGYLFPVDPVCHNSKSRLEGDIDGSPFCGAIPVAADDSNSEIICHKTRHADGSMHTTRCRMLCNKGFILPQHAKKVSRISDRVLQGTTQDEKRPRTTETVQRNPGVIFYSTSI